MHRATLEFTPSHGVTRCKFQHTQASRQCGHIWNFGKFQKMEALPRTVCRPKEWTFGQLAEPDRVQQVVYSKARGSGVAAVGCTHRTAQQAAEKLSTKHQSKRTSARGGVGTSTEYNYQLIKIICWGARGIGQGQCNSDRRCRRVLGICGSNQQQHNGPVACHCEVRGAVPRVGGPSDFRRAKYSRK